MGILERVLESSIKKKMKEILYLKRKKKNA